MLSRLLELQEAKTDAASASDKPLTTFFVCPRVLTPNERFTYVTFQDFAENLPLKEGVIYCFDDDHCEALAVLAHHPQMFGAHPVVMQDHPDGEYSIDFEHASHPLNKVSFTDVISRLVTIADNKATELLTNATRHDREFAATKKRVQRAEPEPEAPVPPEPVPPALAASPSDASLEA